MPDKKMGYFVKRQEPAVLRYYLRYDDEVELARGLCVLFYPFRNEMNDVHSHDPLQLYNETKNTIEAKRKKYEHKSKINELIRNIEKGNESKAEELTMKKIILTKIQQLKTKDKCTKLKLVQHSTSSRP